MTIPEWGRIEDIMTESYGWNKGIIKMIRAKNEVSRHTFLEDFTDYQDRKLRRKIRRLVAHKK